MGLIDAWGTGVKRIRDAAAEYGLPEPEFLEMDDTFRINLYRNSDDANGANDANHDANETSDKHQENIGKASGKHRNNIGKASEKDRESSEKKLNRSQKEIMAIISHDGHITTTEIADKIGISRRNVEENIRVLREEGFLVRRGGRKEGYWEIIPKEDK
jgi:predicted HTH transcriptional regulator